MKIKKKLLKNKRNKLDHYHRKEDKVYNNQTYNNNNQNIIITIIKVMCIAIITKQVKMRDKNTHLDIKKQLKKAKKEDS